MIVPEVFNKQELENKHKLNLFLTTYFIPKGHKDFSNDFEEPLSSKILLEWFTMYSPNNILTQDDVYNMLFFGGFLNSSLELHLSVDKELIALLPGDLRLRILSKLHWKALKRIMDKSNTITPERVLQSIIKYFYMTNKDINYSKYKSILGLQSLPSHLKYINLICDILEIERFTAKTLKDSMCSLGFASLKTYCKEMQSSRVCFNKCLIPREDIWTDVITYGGFLIVDSGLRNKDHKCVNLSDELRNRNNWEDISEDFLDAPHWCEEDIKDESRTEKEKEKTEGEKVIQGRRNKGIKSHESLPEKSISQTRSITESNQFGDIRTRGVKDIRDETISNRDSNDYDAGCTEDSEGAREHSSRAIPERIKMVQLNFILDYDEFSKEEFIDNIDEHLAEEQIELSTEDKEMLICYIRDQK